MFTIYNLFYSPVIKIKVNPTYFDKKTILNTVIKNYRKQPFRNKHDTQSKLHHYYNDWDNEKFDKVDLSSLVNVYDEIFKNLVSNIPNKAPISYQFEIENITVMKNKSNDFKKHNHLNGNIYFACVHYISVGKNSAPLRLHNPLPLYNYLPKELNILRDSKFDIKNPFHSLVCSYYDIIVEEDDMIIIPSFLLHSVTQEENDTKHRVAIATNLSLM